MGTLSPDTHLDAEAAQIRLLRQMNCGCAWRCSCWVKNCRLRHTGICQSRSQGVQLDRLDRAYLLRCAQELGVAHLLRRACEEAALEGEQ